MWTHEASIETSASAETLWRLFEDVAGWPRWNAGIASIALHGAFARGATFTMGLPDGDTVHGTLTEVSTAVCFTDESIVDGNRVAVAHLLVPRRHGGTRVVFRTQVDGPDDTAIGPMVSGDFDDVLRALRSLAEAEAVAEVS
ncbi:MAG: SRPBCC family protein [Rhizobacter sp.]|jgi:hypothetical protein